MKVWIDQDLCTGDGLCEEIAPAVFSLLDDGLAYVKESDQVRSEPGGPRHGSRARGPRRCRHRSGRGMSRRVHLHRTGLSAAGMPALSVPMSTLPLVSAIRLSSASTGSLR